MPATEVPHPDPAQFREPWPDIGSERELLESLLDFHRGTLLWKAARLSPDELVASPAGASTLSILGLVRHVAENERWWFRRQACQLPLDDLYVSEEYPDGELDLADPAHADEDLATLRAEMEASRQAVAEMSLDHTFPAPGVGGGEMSLRWVYLHMIEEYARHNGHADIIRETIDGLTGE